MTSSLETEWAYSYNPMACIVHRANKDHNEDCSCENYKETRHIKTALSKDYLKNKTFARYASGQNIG